MLSSYGVGSPPTAGTVSNLEAACPSYDPAQNMSAYTNAFPIRVYYSTADAVDGAANQEAFTRGSVAAP